VTYAVSYRYTLPYDPPLTRKAALLLCAASRYNTLGVILGALYVALWPRERGKLQSLRAYGFYDKPMPLRYIFRPELC
jgi:hypothetical protein